MRFYIKLEDGTFRKATADEVMATDTVLYVMDGEEYRLLDNPAPVIKDETSAAVETLTQTINDLVAKQNEIAAAQGKTVDDMKQKQEELEKKLAAAREMERKGWPIPAPEIMNSEEDSVEKTGWHLARQGKDLQNKFFHPNYQLPEEKRLPIAKYMTCFLRAAYLKDPAARAEFREKYGPIQQEAGIEIKTPVGDSGNVFPVPDILEEEILAFARESSVALQYARIWPMISEKESFPRETSSVTVEWGNTTPESEPGIEEFELTATEMSAYSAVRNTTLADARSDIVSWLTSNMAEAAGQEIDNKVFNGVGTDDPFICSGVLSAAAGYSVAMASGSTAFSTLYADVLSEMIGKLDGMKKEGARFFMNGAILHFIRSLKDTTGAPIFIETVGSPMSGTIWGYPYTEVIKCPSTSGANTAFIAFCNLRYFAVGRRLDSTALAVDPYGLWTTNRTRFKIYQRWALGIGLANGIVRLLTAAS